MSVVGKEFLVGPTGYTGTLAYPTSASSGVDTTKVIEQRPEMSWSREGYYTVTRRWRGHYAAVLKFSQGGSNDSNGISISAGGAGVDGATETAIDYDEGGSMATLSVTWHSRTAEGGPGESMPAAADVSQFSSLWQLNGNDIEKDILYCPLLVKATAAINSVASGNGNGFGARVKKAVELFQNKQNRSEGTITDYFQKKFYLAHTASGVPTHGIYYFDSSETPWTNLATYDAANSTTIRADLQTLCEDMLKGVTNFPISQFVLRNTKNTQSTSNVSFANYYTDTNKMWNTKQINYMMYLDTYDSISTGILPLIGTICTVFGNTAKWLYRTPTINQNQNGTWTVTREWWYADDYSEILYNDSTWTERSC